MVVKIKYKTNKYDYVMTTLGNGAVVNLGGADVSVLTI